MQRAVFARPDPLANGARAREPVRLRADVARRLADRLAEARGAWPGIDVPGNVFYSHVVERLSLASVTPDEALRAIDRMRAGELFVACACVHGNAVALARFENGFLRPEVDGTFRRFGALPLTVDDVLQRMREKLLVGPRPALAGYAGQGELRGWVRAAALHLLLNIAQREAREAPTEEGFFDALVSSEPDGEAAYLKEACHLEFERAFAAAMAKLSNRQRSLLRYAFADGLNVDQIGAIYRVHRATAARWLAEARVRLVDETRAELVRELRVTESSAASIVRAALSRVGITLIRRFA